MFDVLFSAVNEENAVFLQSYNEMLDHGTRKLVYKNNYRRFN